MAVPKCGFCKKDMAHEWAAIIVDGKRRILIYCTYCGAIWGVIDG